MKRLAETVLIAASLSLRIAANAHTQSAAETFLRQLYAPYVAGTARLDATGKDATRVFAPPLVELLRRDAVRANGEVGALDGDPICDCQDYGHFKLLAVQVQQQTGDMAVVRVRIANLGKTEALTYRLVQGAAGWRVADISGPNMASLVLLLRAGTGLN